MKILKYLISFSAILIFSNTLSNYIIESIKDNKAIILKPKENVENQEVNTQEVTRGEFEGKIIDTKDNQIGINNLDICAVFTDDSLETPKDIIVCQSGRTFDNIKSKKVSNKNLHLVIPSLRKPDNYYIGRTEENDKEIVAYYKESDI